MLLKNSLNCYNLMLALGAFYTGSSMLSKEGVFESFPQEWIGKLPFNNWASLALFGIIIFGIGNAAVSIYGFIKQDRKIFVLTFIMGILFFFSTIIPTISIGEWYLPTGLFFLLSLIQIFFGLIGLIFNHWKYKK